MAKKLQSNPLSKNKKGNKKKKGGDNYGLDETRRTLTGAEGLATDLGLTKDLPTLDTGRLEGNLGTSQDLQDLITTMKGGLAGLSAAENVALIESARRDLDRQYQSTVRDITNENAKTGAGARTGRSFAQKSIADRQRMGALGDMEQDLLVKNIDIQDSRRKALSDVLSNEGDRQTQGLSLLLDAQKANLGQANASQAGKVSAITGIADLAQNSLANRRAFRLARQGMRRGRASSGGSSNNAALVNAITNAANSRFPGISSEV